MFLIKVSETLSSASTHLLALYFCSNNQIKGLQLKRYLGLSQSMPCVVYIDTACRIIFCAEKKCDASEEQIKMRMVAEVKRHSENEKVVRLVHKNGQLDLETSSANITQYMVKMLGKLLAAEKHERDMQSFLPAKLAFPGSPDSHTTNDNLASAEKPALSIPDQLDAEDDESPNESVCMSPVPLPKGLPPDFDLDAHARTIRLARWFQKRHRAREAVRVFERVRALARSDLSEAEAFKILHGICEMQRLVRAKLGTSPPPKLGAYRSFNSATSFSDCTADSMRNSVVGAASNMFKLDIFDADGELVGILEVAQGADISATVATFCSAKGLPQAQEAAIIAHFASLGVLKAVDATSASPRSRTPVRAHGVQPPQDHKLAYGSMLAEAAAGSATTDLSFVTPSKGLSQRRDGSTSLDVHGTDGELLGTVVVRAGDDMHMVVAEFCAKNKLSRDQGAAIIDQLSPSRRKGRASASTEFPQVSLDDKTRAATDENVPPEVVTEEVQLKVDRTRSRRVGFVGKLKTMIVGRPRNPGSPSPP